MNAHTASVLTYKSYILGSLMILLLWSMGCDDADTTSVLTVSHFRNNAEIQGAIEMESPEAVVVKATFPEEEEREDEENLLLPLKWSVHNPDLGGIISSGGHTAVYEGNGQRGQNVIFVKDQQDREGVIAVNQR